jgi:hypothetical protein
LADVAPPQRPYPPTGLVGPTCHTYPLLYRPPLPQDPRRCVVGSSTLLVVAGCRVPVSPAVAAPSLPEGATPAPREGARQGALPRCNRHRWEEPAVELYSSAVVANVRCRRPDWHNYPLVLPPIQRKRMSCSCPSSSRRSGSFTGGTPPCSCSASSPRAPPFSVGRGASHHAQEPPPRPAPRDGIRAE